jgi:hypothetical protein
MGGFKMKFSDRRYLYQHPIQYNRWMCRLAAGSSSSIEAPYEERGIWARTTMTRHGYSVLCRVYDNHSKGLADHL